MHPLLFEELAQERIESLHREAARQRLVRRRQVRKGKPRRVFALRLQRAPTS